MSHNQGTDSAPITKSEAGRANCHYRRTGPREYNPTYDAEIQDATMTWNWVTRAGTAIVMAICVAGVASAAERTAKERTKLFKKFDLNEDGIVDRDEFATEMINIFISVDANGSEFIETDELTNPDPSEFSDADRNKDGKLSFDEVMSEKLGDFRRADKNRDRKLTLEEVLEAKKQ